MQCSGYTRAAELKYPDDWQTPGSAAGTEAPLDERIDSPDSTSPVLTKLSAPWGNDSPLEGMGRPPRLPPSQSLQAP